MPKNDARDSIDQDQGDKYQKTAKIMESQGTAMFTCLLALNFYTRITYNYLFKK